MTKLPYESSHWLVGCGIWAAGGVCTSVPCSIHGEIAIVGIRIPSRVKLNPSLVGILQPQFGHNHRIASPNQHPISMGRYVESTSHGCARYGTARWMETAPK